MACRYWIHSSPQWLLFVLGGCMLLRGTVRKFSGQSSSSMSP